MISLRVLIKELERVTGKKANIVYRPKQPGDVLYTCASIEKARRRLHYRPRTTIQQGLQRFYQWFLQHEDVLLTY